MANQGKRMVKENLISQIGQGGGSDLHLVAGTGIDITAGEVEEDKVISVDTNTIATKAELGSFAESFGSELNNILNTGTSVVQRAKNDENGNEIDTTYATKAELPAAVSGTNDGTNWTSLTVGSDTYAIPQGGGASYLAGTGIDITNNTISVDNTIATKAELNARAGTFYSYMETPEDVYNELGTGNLSEAVNEWCKRMPAFVSANIDAAGMAILESKGFKNLVQIELGARYDIQGYFSIIMQGTTVSMPEGMQICMADRVGNTSKDLYSTAPGARIQHTVVIGASELEFQNCRFREANTSLHNYYDLFSNQISFVQQMGVNSQTDATLGMSNAYIAFAGRQAETFGISIQGGTQANKTYGNQLAAPTVDGSYQLGCTVSYGAPTFAWGAAVTPGTQVSGTNDGTNWTSLTVGSDTYAIPSGGSTPTNMMTTNSAQTSLSGNKEYNTGTYYRFGVLNSGNPWSQISNTQISNNDGVSAVAYFSNGILTVQDNSTSHLIQARPDYLEHSIDGGSTGDKIYFDDLVALIAYAKSQG